jgi:hypothetical protein
MLCGVATQLFGDSIGFVAQIDARSGTLAIANVSTNDAAIERVEIHLGDGAAFGAAGLTVADGDATITVQHDFAATSAGDSVLTALTDGGTELTLAPLPDGETLDGAASTTLEFAGLDAGDVWGGFAAFVSALNPGRSAAGSDFNNALLVVRFSGGQVLISTFEGGPTLDAESDQGVFHFGAWMNVGAGAGGLSEPDSRPDSGRAAGKPAGTFGTSGFIGGGGGGGGGSGSGTSADSLATDPPPIGIPQPSSLVLFGVGLLIYVAARRRSAAGGVR